MAQELELEPGRNCWKLVRADRAALIVDAADYFRLARDAMRNARAQILLIGWDFDTRITLDPECEDGGPKKLGAFLTWLADRRPGLEIRILKWDIGAIKLLGRGTTIFRLARWMAHPRITFKLDGAHPVGGSHHHKIVVVDDRLAFCGGIDMTAARWDTRAHEDGDPRRKRPTTGRRYGPWHDATMAVSGEAARALGELSRERWRIAGGGAVPTPIVTEEPWPETLAADFSAVRIAIARTRAAHGGMQGIREVERLYVDMIGAARRFVYAENQFFASRVIAKAIAERLQEPDGPEFVLVNPRRVDGWLEEEVMSPARARLIEELRRADPHRRLRIYTPATEQGEDIYVHSKIVVVDDRWIRVGSANINNRSMGLDSECDLLIDGDGSRDEAVRAGIGRLRAALVAEHLGVDAARVEQAHRTFGSLTGAIESLRGRGRTLLPFEPEPPNALEEAVADRELLDPESAGEAFEPLARPGLLVGLRRIRSPTRA